MKVGEIIEMTPPDNPIGEQPPTYWKSKIDLFFSKSTMKRNYTKLEF